MLEKLKEYLTKQLLINCEDPCLLAVSGGMDSMVMAHLFIRSGYKIAIIHANFNLRNQESDADEKFVSDFSAKHGIPFYSKSFDTRKFSQGEKISVQMAAREIRYQWFEECRQKYGYRYIATAHHGNDSIETLIINMLRGCGLNGLHGIPAKQGRIIRPLLFTTRNEIEKYALDHQVPYRNDSSNDQDYYLRNKIRHHLIPLLNELQPQFHQIMAENIARWTESGELIQDYLKIIRDKNLTEKNGLYYLDVEDIKRNRNASTILHYLLKDFGFNESQTSHISKALSGMPGKQFLSENYLVNIDRNKLIIKKLNQYIQEDILITESDTRINLNNHEILLISSANNEIKQFKTPPQKIMVNTEKLKFPLMLRRWKKGDAFYPYGIRGKKKISDFLVDLKISRPEKDDIWILCDQENIVWVVGYAADKRFAINRETGKITSFEYFNNSSGT